MPLSHQPEMTLIVEVLWIQLFSSFFMMWIQCSINCFAVVALEWCIWCSASQPQRAGITWKAAALHVKGSCKSWALSSLSHCTHFAVVTPYLNCKSEAVVRLGFSGCSQKMCGMLLSQNRLQQVFTSV